MDDFLLFYFGFGIGVAAGAWLAWEFISAPNKEDDDV